MTKIVNLKGPDRRFTDDFARKERQKQLIPDNQEAKDQTKFIVIYLIGAIILGLSFYAGYSHACGDLPKPFEIKIVAPAI